MTKTTAAPPTSCATDVALEGLDCVSDGATRYVVDQSNPAASDDNPGSVERPWRTISRASLPGALRPGDAVVIRAGVYRESVQPREGGTGPSARITYAAWPGDRVIVSGADLASDGWRRVGDAWRRAWHGPGLPSYADDPVFRRELVVANGTVLGPVADRDSLLPGQFWPEGSDESPTALWVRFPEDVAPEDVGDIEVARRARLFWPRGATPDPECGAGGTPGWLRVVGITFRHAANRAQWGALCAGSVGGLVEDVRVVWTNGRGIDASGRDHIFRRVRADFNAQMGWGGACDRCLIEDASAVGNNWRGYDPFWEAGGMKLVRTSDTVIRRFYAAHNDGPGIWLDIDNTANTIEGSLSVGNQVAGIMVELRTTETTVQHNVVALTRWREWTGTGILSQAASRNTFSRNTIVANEGTGLWLRLDPDRRAADGGNRVTDNWIVGNATGGVEARELSVEGTDPEHVRSTEFADNVVGQVESQSSRSTFFIHPAPSVSQAGFRSGNVEVWRRLTGASGTQVVRRSTSPTSGADRRVVRADGDWQSAPPRPPWPR